MDGVAIEFPLSKGPEKYYYLNRATRKFPRPPQFLKRALGKNLLIKLLRGLANWVAQQ